MPWDQPVDQDWTFAWRQVALLHGVFERLQCLSLICSEYCPCLPGEHVTNGNSGSFLAFPASYYSIRKAFPLRSHAAITIFLNWARICFLWVSVLTLYTKKPSHSSSFLLFLLFYFLFCFCCAIFFSAGKQLVSQSAEMQTMTSLSN